MKKLIALTKNLRKQSYLNRQYKHQYAFVGIGSHSTTNLYPVLAHLGVPLKYIITRNKKNAVAISRRFSGAVGTNDFEEVLADQAIKGIFICAHPDVHFSLTKKALQAGKNVFVEKPPCQSHEELKNLIQIEKSSEGFCLVGLQKRYAPCYQLLKKKTKNVTSYNLRYLVGNYPEGNAVTDLFIHPIDLIAHLFGPSSIESLLVIKNGSAVSVFLHLRHKSAFGNIELSTDYGWETAQEELSVNSPKGIYRTNNCETLVFEKKAGSLLSIPKEKIFPQQFKETRLFNKNSFLPMMTHNEIFTAGYFSEIENFVKISEGQKGENRSRLGDLVSTYQLLEKVNTTI